jgi:antitoxin (DNA-binding transcriptional repressor) of toxin-antitoxin stability system
LTTSKSPALLVQLKTATVTQLRRGLGRVLNWIEDGESVFISRRGINVALLSPPLSTKPRQRKKRPDFAARLKRIFDNKVFSGNIVVEDRNSRPF